MERSHPFIKKILGHINVISRDYQGNKSQQKKKKRREKQRKEKKNWELEKALGIAKERNNVFKTRKREGCDCSSTSRRDESDAKDVGSQCNLTATTAQSEVVPEGRERTSGSSKQFREGSTETEGEQVPVRRQRGEETQEGQTEQEEQAKGKHGTRHAEIDEEKKPT